MSSKRHISQRYRRDGDHSERRREQVDPGCSGSAEYDDDTSSKSYDLDDDHPGKQSTPRIPEPVNAFKNDGSFLAMFKKAQGSSTTGSNIMIQSVPTPTAPVIPPPCTDSLADNPAPAQGTSTKPKSFGFVGKRRGGKILPTGKVKKTKQDEEDEGSKDPWSQYLSEVKKYKDQSCQEESGVRPLVK